jgi:hypothetical protein
MGKQIDAVPWLGSDSDGVPPEMDIGGLLNLQTCGILVVEL